MAFCLFLAVTARAGNNPIVLTQRQVVEISAQLIVKGEFDDATTLLTRQSFDVLELEIERLYLLGRIAAKEERYRDAIKIWRHILDHQPGLSKIRLELALAYMAMNQWYRADYHMRLAASDPDLPLSVQMEVRRYLFIIRQNKNWNIWVNLGMAPDNNVNNAVGGEECITYSPTFGYFPYPLCRKLSEPERAMGYNFGIGGDYEFRFGQQWRLKNDFAVQANFYDKSQYNMYFLSASSGPRYVFPRGDVWLAATGHKMYYGGDDFRNSLGLKLDANYDFTRRLSGNLLLNYSAMDYYGDMANYMDGAVYGAGLRFVYNLDASKFLVFRTGVDRENTKEDAYSNWRHNYAVGFGAEIPFGFRVYVEPSVAWTNFDGGRWTVAETQHGSEYIQVVERQFTQRYMASLSNNRFTLYGFTPVINYSYTNRESNINSRSFSKHAIGFTVQQRF